MKLSEKILETVNCNICGSDEKELVTEKSQHNIPISLVLCKSCGLGYLSPRWDEKGYLTFYKNEYDNYYRPNLSTKKEDKKNHIIKRLKDRNLANDFKNILDIGSGAGENLIALGKEFTNAKLYAIEPSPVSQEILAKNGVEVLSDSVNSTWDQDIDVKFDLIIMRHVLEHFLNPLEILKRVENSLAEGGLLYVAVPNNLNPFGNLEKAWFRAVHTYYFNKHSLNNIFILANLESIEIVEGDKFNKWEVFSFLQKRNENSLPKFENAHFEIQRDLFKSILKKQKEPLYYFQEKIEKLKIRFFK